MSSNWPEIENLFFHALQTPAADREHWLQDATRGREDLMREVLTLLEAHEASEAEPALRRIGVYRLEERVGRGGMGEVWRASRADGQFEQKVAVKLVRSGLGSDLLLRRFQSERQLLARLNHPNIARLIDGGVSAGGRPYLVMEYVDGAPILDYAQRHNLPVRARVELFRPLCAAVAYAHRNLIVHRDLKPSNVLVDAAGAPKLLDFGIARLIETEEASTASAFPLLTPRYASPEQLRGEPATTSTDVYSLGVLLFELLTGELPYELRGNAPAELITAITTQDARLASRTVKNRGISGDLDSILAKALDKDPARRYDSVEALSGDLANYLDGLPVLARRQTRRYRAWKYVRRHWAGVSAAAAVALILAGATAVSVRSARLADRQRQRSDRITRFVVDLLTAANPMNRASGMETGKDARLVDVMAAASTRLATQFADDPGIQSQLHAQIGRAFIGMGNYPAGEAELQAALSHLSALDAQPAEKARVLHAAARLDYDEGRVDSALQRQRQAVDLFGASPEARQDPRTFSVMLNNLAIILDTLHKPAEAAGIFSRSIQALQSLPAPPAFEIGVLRNNIAGIYMEQGHLDKAGQETRLAIANLSSLPSPPVFLGYAEMNAGLLARWTGHPEEALADLEKGAADGIRIAGPDHPYVLTMRIERDYQRALAGKAAEAEADLKQCLETAKHARGGVNPRRAMAALGYVRMLAGKPRDGEPLLREALAAMQRSQFPMSVAMTELDLADCLARQGKIEEARGLYTQARDSFQKLFGPDAWLTRDAARRLRPPL